MSHSPSPAISTDIGGIENGFNADFMEPHILRGPENWNRWFCSICCSFPLNFDWTFNNYCMIFSNFTILVKWEWNSWYSSMHGTIKIGNNKNEDLWEKFYKTKWMERDEKENYEKRQHHCLEITIYWSSYHLSWTNARYFLVHDVPYQIQWLKMSGSEICEQFTIALIKHFSICYGNIAVSEPGWAKK